MQQFPQPAEVLGAANSSIRQSKRAESGQIQTAASVLLTRDMQNITSFRQLLVWRKSMDLAVRCYGVVREFPRSEQMVLGYQIRKCAVSMPSNIAEGFSRHSTASYVQHLWIAHASGAELETQLELGRRIEIIDGQKAEILIGDAKEIARMINGLVRSLERAPLNNR